MACPNIKTMKIAHACELMYKRGTGNPVISVKANWPIMKINLVFVELLSNSSFRPIIYNFLKTNRVALYKRLFFASTSHRRLVS